jgi:outer membrane receptor protein involved in Fe transport
VSYDTGLTARVHPALRLFLNYSVAQNPAVNMFPDPLGQPLKDAQNTGVEYGVKSSLLNERINLSLSRYTTDAKNEFFLLGIGGSVNPSGLNGSVPGRGSWSNVDRKSDGYELSIDGAPARGWMMRLTAGMQQGRTGYSNGRGEPGLLRVLADRYTARRGRAIGTDQIMCFPGTQTTLFAVLHGLVQAGDEVILGDPLYATYEGLVAATGATLVPVPLRPEHGFRLQAADVAARLTQRSRVLFLNSPHNPTGMVVRTPIAALDAHHLEC